MNLPEALEFAYRSNPQLLKERAVLEQTDENVPKALSGWRPTISGSAAGNYSKSNYVTYPYGGAFRYNQRFSAPGYGVGITIKQPLFMGGKTVASTHRAMNTIYQERAILIQTEQQVFQNVVSAYVSMTQSRKVLALTIENERTLSGQVQLTTRQLTLNQATETDVLQAKSQYETARAATRQAESDVSVAAATFQRTVGTPPPGRLAEPSPATNLPRSQHESEDAATESAPQLSAAKYALAASQNAVDVAFGSLWPQISAQASFERQVNQGEAKFDENATTATIQATIPLYQGGGEYAQIRAARRAAIAARHELEEQRRIVIQTATTAWQKLLSDRDQLARNQNAVSFGEAALRSIQKQELLGVRTTFEVLQQQQLLFQQQKLQLQNIANTVIDSYALAAAIGRLTADALHIDPAPYDPTIHLRAVKWKLFGIK
uniref:TolC family outer membrane protein n=1 Tax=Gluconobacter thailandicus TaxID=257438 RepID=UPI0007772460|nr:TolC family outer membrane protein [Gluconobacter thailandicus]